MLRRFIPITADISSVVRGFGDTINFDEVFVRVRTKQHYLWCAGDKDADVVDVYLQDRRDGRAAKRFFPPTDTGSRGRAE